MSGFHTERVRFRAQGDTLFLPPTAYETIIADADLVAYWRMGEASGTLADSSGNGFDLSIGGTGAAIDYGQTNANISDDDGAIALNGVSVPPERTTGQVLYGESVPLFPYRSGAGSDVSDTFRSSEPFTIMGWFNPKSFPGAINYFPLFTCNAGSGGTGPIMNDIWYCPYTGQVMVVDKDEASGRIVHSVITSGEGGVGAAPIYSTATITTSVWTHVAWTYSGAGDNNLYINGALDTNWTNAHSHTVSYTFPVAIGESDWFDAFTAQFFGETQFHVAYAEFDEWAVFSAVKTPSFIATVAGG